jgi:hypothetical protein
MTRAILLAFACLAATAFAQAEKKSIAEILGDRMPTTAERTMISPTPPEQRLAGVVYIGGYEVIGKTAAISKEQSAQLATLLKDSAGFPQGQPAKCGFRPGVVFRFGSGADAIDMLVCFSCDEIALVPYGKDAVATSGFSQSSRDVMLNLTKKLFPTDEAIQALPKVRSEQAVPPPVAPVPADAPRPGDPPPGK